MSDDTIERDDDADWDPETEDHGNSVAEEPVKDNSVYRSTAMQHPLPAKKTSCPYCAAQDGTPRERAVFSSGPTTLFSTCTKCAACQRQNCSEKKYTHLEQLCLHCGNVWKIRPADLDVTGIYLNEHLDETPKKEEATKSAPVTLKFPGTPNRKKRGFLLRTFVFLFKFSLILGTLSAGVVLLVLFVLRRLLPSYCGN